MPVTQGQEGYSLATNVLPVVQALPAPARNIMAVLGVNFIQTATLFIPLKRVAWSELNRALRCNPFQGLPVAWAMQGLGEFFIAPLPPGPNYTIEVDCIYLPNNLKDSTDVETAIPDPLSELVPLMAARLASYYEQDKARRDDFIINYEMEKNMMLASMPPFSVSNRYT